MTRFVVLAFAPMSALEKMKDMIPEQTAQGMKLWMEWAERCGDGLVDLGSPLGNGREIRKDDSGPSRKEVAGYMILEAENMDGAMALLENHPHLSWDEGCSFEMYEALPLPGMEG